MTDQLLEKRVSAVASNSQLLDKSETKCNSHSSQGQTSGERKCLQYLARTVLCPHLSRKACRSVNSLITSVNLWRNQARSRFRCCGKPSMGFSSNPKGNLLQVLGSGASTSCREKSATLREFRIPLQKRSPRIGWCRNRAPTFRLSTWSREVFMSRDATSGTALPRNLSAVGLDCNEESLQGKTGLRLTSPCLLSES